MSSETVSVDCTLKATTDLAILIDTDTEEVWLPISQVFNFSYDWEIDDLISVDIPEWLAIERGLV